MIWRGRRSILFFTVNNKTDDPIKIIWDGARLIDEKGISHRLNHSGIGYEERNLSQPPTIVCHPRQPRGFPASGRLFPMEPIGSSTSDKQDGYWDRAPFLPTQIKGTAEELRTKSDPVIGKNLPSDPSFGNKQCSH